MLIFNFFGVVPEMSPSLLRYPFLNLNAFNQVKTRSPSCLGHQVMLLNTNGFKMNADGYT